jgi:glucose-6-phosphate 1-dehydrogenase
MVQNHMMHLLCLVAMEPPVSLDADAVRNEKLKVLQALRPIPPDCASDRVVRGQYTTATVGGQRVPGYHAEDSVGPDSTTETFTALKVLVDNWRWAGVPFYLRTGKRLAQRRTEISVHFKPVPRVLFSAPPMPPLAPNILVIRVQPAEGIFLVFQAKQPGPAMKIRPLKMDFSYEAAFGGSPPDAYQRLLLDAAAGDATLFTRNDEIEAAWRFVTPVIEGFARYCAATLPEYPAGSWGPDEADGLIRADGRRWHLPYEG